MTPAGRLRHKVTIQQLSTGSPQQDGTGAPDQQWAALFTDIWAAVEPLQGRELFAAQEFHSEVTTRIRILYRSGITHLMRVVHGSDYYDIRAVIDPDKMHRELHLLCATGVVTSAVVGG